jgi:PLP dependent protein
MQLCANWQLIRDEIAQACKTAHRDASEICLVAVSKGREFNKIKELYHLGQRHFGESYAQEFHEKFLRARAEHLDIIWHFIGGIQSNKLKFIKDASVVHSIASIHHATQLNEYAVEPIDIFIQINLVQTPHQQGIRADDVFAFIEAIKKLSRLRLRGLMTIAPQDAAEPWFLQLAALRDAIIERGLMREVELSMGMSNDFAIAIQCGSHVVRVGTRIFEG